MENTHLKYGLKNILNFFSVVFWQACTEAEDCFLEYKHTCRFQSIALLSIETPVIAITEVPVILLILQPIRESILSLMAKYIYDV